MRIQPRRSTFANKARACERAGITGRTTQLPATTTQSELADVVASLNDDAAVDGILVQLPLPSDGDLDTIEQRTRFLIWSTPPRMLIVSRRSMSDG